jgi:spore coat protein CotH
MRQLFGAMCCALVSGCQCGTPPVERPTADAATVASSTLTDPFPADRVIEVRIELDATAWQAMLAAPEAEQYQRGNLIFDGIRRNDIGLRTKGNSSLRSVAQLRSHRFSFKLDLDRYVDGQELLGVDKLDLNNGFKDPTLLREALGYGVVRDFGLAAPRTAFADLWVAGEHLGLYTLVEEVEGTFLRRNFADTSGDLYKPEPPAGNLAYLGSDFAAYQGMQVERNAETTDHAALLRLLQVLDQGQTDQYDSVLDVAQVLRYLATVSVLVNLDSYVGMGHNYYLYEAQPGRFTIIPWDLNETFGNFSCGCNRAGLIGFLLDEPTCGPIAARPLCDKLLQVPANRAAYQAAVQQLLDGLFAPAAIEPRIDGLATLIRPYVAADPTKFFTTEQFEQGLGADVSGGMGTAIGLKPFVDERGVALRAQLAGSAASTNQGRGNCGNQTQPCGDGVCDATEQQNPALCPRDCADAGGVFPCGDGVCDSAEQQNVQLCPRDCVDAGAGFDWCGDGICDALEQRDRSCARDCD